MKRSWSVVTQTIFTLSAAVIPSLMIVPHALAATALTTPPASFRVVPLSMPIPLQGSLLSKVSLPSPISPQPKVKKALVNGDDDDYGDCDDGYYDCLTPDVSNVTPATLTLAQGEAGGQLMTITGSGFSEDPADPDDEDTVYIVGPQSTTNPQGYYGFWSGKYSATPDYGDGGWLLQVSLPANLPSGTYGFIVCYGYQGQYDDCSYDVNGNWTFNVAVGDAVLSSVKPNFIPPGSAATLIGKNFDPTDNYVYMLLVNPADLANPSYLGPEEANLASEDGGTQLPFTAPATVGGRFWVTAWANHTSSWSNWSDFTTGDLSKMSPVSGGIGTNVSITGSGFGTMNWDTGVLDTTGDQVTLTNPTKGTYTVTEFTTETATNLAFSIPTDMPTGAYAVSVENGDGYVCTSANNCDDGLTLFVIGPTIASLSDSSVDVGDTFNITGTGFTPTGNIVTIVNDSNEYSDTVSSADGKTLENIKVPANAQSGTYTVTVENGNGDKSNGQTLNITESTPTLTSVEPVTGPAGIAVTISGNNFSTDSSNQVLFTNAQYPGQNEANEVSSDGTTLAFSLGDTTVAGVYDVSVEANGESTENNPPVTFSVQPQLSSTAPVTTIVGGPVNIQGIGMSPSNNTITLSGPTTLSIPNVPYVDGSLGVSLPNSIGVGTYTVFVTTNGVQSSNSFQLIVEAAPVIIPPSNLVASVIIDPRIDDSIPGTLPGINLTWVNNSPNATGFQIASDGSTIGNTQNGSTDSFFDNLTGASSINGIYQVRAALPGGPYTAWSATTSVPTCALIAGSVTAPDAIVFIKGDGWNVDASDYLSDVENIVENGYLSTDPFKTYSSKLSFYIDTVPFPQASLGKEGIYYNNAAYSQIISDSHCGPAAFEYVFLFADPSIYAAFSQFNHIIAFMNMGAIVTDAKGQVPNWGFSGVDLATSVMHETGHALGGLTDEYYTSGATGNDVFIGKNCSVFPYDDFHDTIDGHMYGSVNLSATSTQGCTYASTVPLEPNNITDEDQNDTRAPIDASELASDLGVPLPLVFYRPSSNSIMADNNIESGLPFYNEYNVISCGYMVSAILDEPTDKPHAQLHWPATDLETRGIGCDSPAMNTTKDGISAPNPTAPSNIVVSNDNTMSVGDPIVSGQGFTPTGNSVELIYVSGVTAGSIAYQANNLPSPDGKDIAFTIPATTTPSTYYLKVSALNSPWSVPITVTVIEPQVASFSSSTAAPGSTITLTGEGFPTAGSLEIELQSTQQPSKVTLVPINLSSWSSMSFVVPPVAAGTYNTYLAYTYNRTIIQTIKLGFGNFTVNSPASPVIPQPVIIVIPSPVVTTPIYDAPVVVPAQTTTAPVTQPVTQPVVTPVTQSTQTTQSTTASVTQAVAQPVIAPTANLTASVEQLYQTLLYRTADQAGLNYWVNSGMTLAQIQAGIMATPEYQGKAQIANLYETLLNRAPDPGGMTYWYGVMQQSGIDAVKSGIMQTVEYRHLHSVSSFYFSPATMLSNAWNSFEGWFGLH